MQQLIVRGAPQIYQCSEGSWQKLPDYLKEWKLDKILLLHGSKSWQAAQKYLPDLKDFYVRKAYYGKEVTDDKKEELSQLIKTEQLQGVVAVGGGKVSDLAKAVCHELHIPVFILPTLAATCAAYSTLSVMYNPDGSMNRYDVFETASALVLIEPAVILHSPKELMIAGIGDTLAKWYEAAPLIEQMKYQPMEIKVASFAARKCRDVLLSDSLAALQAMDEQTLNQAFLNIVETNILLAGLVGGFGDDYGRTSGAHSIHDALTTLADSHKVLHGKKVAYGILVQLMIEGKVDEIKRLKDFYQLLALPGTLKEMDLELSESDYQKVGQRAALPNEQIHFLPQKITADIVIQAMKKLEKLA